jgi:hypothetical protein
VSGWQVEFTIYAELLGFDHPLATDRPLPRPPFPVEVSLAADGVHRLLLVDWSDLERGRISGLRIFQVATDDIVDITVDDEPATTARVTTSAGHFVLGLASGPGQDRPPVEALLSLTRR